MIPLQKMTLAELAAYICTYLLQNGIKCVLSGGACVSIYTENRYMSYDLDFIEMVTAPRKEIKEILSQIGFYEENRYFKHNDTNFFIEFPTGPLSIGSEPVWEFNELVFDTGKLYLLTPTDCVKDRLAAYYFWNDLQALEQAKWVAEKHKINIDEVQRWSQVENQKDKFLLIKNKLLLE
ncbi:hypothetical protein JXQ31_04125 [candidate division KSB1 bacterium]|nr:hypothetical protein [candidate division KSB1 bacterium]